MTSALTSHASARSAPITKTVAHWSFFSPMKSEKSEVTMFNTSPENSAAGGDPAVFLKNKRQLSPESNVDIVPRGDDVVRAHVHYDVRRFRDVPDQIEIPTPDRLRDRVERIPLWCRIHA
jgi:hypothetical protein